MGSLYKILNYSARTIIMNLTQQEVCVACKILMQLPNPQFDIVQDTKFVTSSFAELKNGSWEFQPAIEERSV